MSAPVSSPLLWELLVFTSGCAHIPPADSRGLRVSSVLRTVVPPLNLILSAALLLAVPDSLPLFSPSSQQRRTPLLQARTHHRQGFCKLESHPPTMACCSRAALVWGVVATMAAAARPLAGGSAGSARLLAGSIRCKGSPAGAVTVEAIAAARMPRQQPGRCSDGRTQCCEASTLSGIMRAASNRLRRRRLKFQSLTAGCIYAPYSVPYPLQDYHFKVVALFHLQPAFILYPIYASAFFLQGCCCFIARLFLKGCSADYILLNCRRRCRLC